MYTYLIITKISVLHTHTIIVPKSYLPRLWLEESSAFMDILRILQGIFLYCLYTQTIGKDRRRSKLDTNKKLLQ